MQNVLRDNKVYEKMISAIPTARVKINKTVRKISLKR